MKIWILNTIDRLQEKDGDFHPWTMTAGFVIAAPDEGNARKLAAKEADGRWWLNPEHTTCIEAAGEPARVIMANTPTG